MRQRLDYIDGQCYICFDGPDGLIIQTSMESFLSYYKWLGWELLGRAAPLPIIGDNGNHQAPIMEPEPELCNVGGCQENGQGRLF